MVKSTAIAAGVLLTMLCWIAPASGMEMTLSDALSLLRLDLQTARQQAQLSKDLSKRQMHELERLSSEVQTLNADLLASRILREQALQQAMELSEQLKQLTTELADSRKLSSEQALEISALISDRDGWKGRAQRRGKAILYGILGGLILAGATYVVGLAQ